MSTNVNSAREIVSDEFLEDVLTMMARPGIGFETNEAALLYLKQVVIEEVFVWLFEEDYAPESICPMTLNMLVQEQVYDFCGTSKAGLSRLTSSLIQS